PRGGVGDSSFVIRHSSLLAQPATGNAPGRSPVARRNPEMARVTINHIRDKKVRGERITMLTAYDYITARLLDEAGVDLLLVGDSVGSTVLGYENTLPVTLEEMLHHTRAVVRGTKRALVVGDMPFMTYQLSEEQALTTAGRFLKETGCQAVKLEGGIRSAPA